MIVFVMEDDEEVGSATAAAKLPAMRLDARQVLPDFFCKFFFFV